MMHAVSEDTLEPGLPPRGMLESALAPAERDERAARLLAEDRGQGTLDRIARMFVPLVRHLAGRFAHRGEPLDDLIQVANVGLLKAAARFDPDAGARFSTYAVPTIIGELKRHFRDTGWSMRVPRQLQERSMRVRSLMGSMAQTLGRSPTISELAERTGLSPDDVLEAIDASNAYRPEALEPVPDDNVPAVTEMRFEAIEGWAGVAPSLRRLPAREQALLYHRFVDEMSQREIAAKLGISQMHVSRLLRRTLETLREQAGVALDEAGDEA